MSKLSEAPNSKGFEDKAGIAQYALMKYQYSGMQMYKTGLSKRLENLNIEI